MALGVSKLALSTGGRIYEIDAASELPPGYVVPAEGEVLEGTQYGADGTEFTGTLVVPATGAGSDEFAAAMGGPGWDDLIAEHGETITLRAKGDPSYDASTSVATEAETDYTVAAIVTDYTLEERQESEGLIQRGDLKVEVVVEVEEGEELRVRGEWRRAIEVSEPVEGIYTVLARQ